MDTKNVLVCGYVKSGTTWLTRLCAQLIDCPAAGHWGIDEKTLETEGLDRKSAFACYKSHLRYDELKNATNLPIEKVIYIVRDPRDIIISGAFHFNFYPNFLRRLTNSNGFVLPSLIRKIKLLFNKTRPFKKKVESMSSALINGDDYKPHMRYAWDDHVRSYLEKDVLVLRYEDLLSDGFNTAKRLLAFVGIEKPDEDIRRDLLSQSFEKRKAEFDNSKQKEKSSHLREGKSASWKKYLNNEQNKVIVLHFQELMSKFKYEL